MHIVMFEQYVLLKMRKKACACKFHECYCREILHLYECVYLYHIYIYIYTIYIYIYVHAGINTCGRMYEAGPPHTHTHAHTHTSPPPMYPPPPPPSPCGVGPVVVPSPRPCGFVLWWALHPPLGLS